MVTTPLTSEEAEKTLAQLEENKQTRKPRAFASVVRSLVDDIIKPSNQEED